MILFFYSFSPSDQPTFYSCLPSELSPLWSTVNLEISETFPIAAANARVFRKKGRTRRHGQSDREEVSPIIRNKSSIRAGMTIAGKG